MQHEILSRHTGNERNQVTIRDPRAAAVFAHSNLRRILLQFARRPRGVADVANELDVDLKQLHHAVTRLCRLQLLKVVQERKRAGRSIKLYQCTGQSYFIPIAAAPEHFSKGLAKELYDAIARDAASAVDGMVFSLDAQGRVSGRAVERHGARAVLMDSWRILRLSASAARQLKQELAKVLDRFQNQASSGEQVYLVHAGMARRLGHRGAIDNPALDGDIEIRD